METIIITALVSVVITLVVGYFIWSAIGVRKLKKQVKNNSEDIQTIYRELNAINILIHDLNNQQNQQLGEQIQWVSKDMDSRFEDIHKFSDEYANFMTMKDDELHRELDKRFDKIYQIIGDNKK